MLWRFNHLLIIKSRKKFKVTKSKRYIVRKEIMGTSEKIRSGYLLYRTCIFSIIVIIFKLVMQIKRIINIISKVGIQIKLIIKIIFKL